MLTRIAGKDWDAAVQFDREYRASYVWQTKWHDKAERFFAGKYSVEMPLYRTLDDALSAMGEMLMVRSWVRVERINGAGEPWLILRTDNLSGAAAYTLGDITPLRCQFPLPKVTRK